MLTSFFQQLLNGIVLGSSYALIALGLTIIFGILEVVNFAHGEFYMIGAYVTFFLSTFFGIPFLLAILLSMAVVSALGIIIERVVFRPIIGKPMINGMLLSFGLSTFLMSLALLLFKADPRNVDSGYEGINISFLGLQITLERLLVIIVVFLLVGFLYLFVKKTKIGMAMLAVAQEREAAQMVGVDIARIYSVAFAIGCALSAAAGSLVGAIFLVSPSMGWAPVIKSFAVVILGGFGNASGAILASLMLGLIEALGGAYLSYAYKDSYGFILLLLVLSLKSEGLIGGRK